eukprot:365926-Chlamydomonas_euryale.AAC.2
MAQWNNIVGQTKSPEQTCVSPAKATACLAEPTQRAAAAWQLHQQGDNTDFAAKQAITSHAALGERFQSSVRTPASALCAAGREAHPPNMHCLSVCHASSIDGLHAWSSCSCVSANKLLAML